MGDRAPAFITLLEVYEVDRAEVKNLLLDLGFGDDWEGNHIPTLHVPGAYFQAEAPVGIEDELHPTLDRCTYFVHQDARYEHDAIMQFYAPDLGEFRCFATQDGEPLVSIRSVEQAFLVQADIGSPPSMATDEAHRKLDIVTGHHWFQRFAKFESTENWTNPFAGWPR